MLENLLVVNSGHVTDQLHHLVGVAALVVVPGNNLHKGVGQSDTGLLVEDGGAGIAQEVRGNNFLIGVTQNALQLALGSVLHGLADILIGGGFSQLDGQVHNGNVQSGNTHGHTGELAVQLGDDLADSLGSAGGGGDDVAGSSTAAAPILQLEYDLLWVNQGYGTAIPSGWLIALPYLRNNAHVRLIVPSKMGHTTAQQYVNPYFYDIWKFEKAKS